MTQKVLDLIGTRPESLELAPVIIGRDLAPFDDSAAPKAMAQSVSPYGDDLVAGRIVEVLIRRFQACE